jgi:hypothetical protein
MDSLDATALHQGKVALIADLPLFSSLEGFTEANSAIQYSPHELSPDLSLILINCRIQHPTT